jgi:pseudouridine-5'-phosphate glycosidase
MLAIFFKAMPQLIMGYNFVVSGSGSGLSLVALIIGHCTIWIRLSQLALIVRRAEWKWNRNDIGIVVAETGNEASWIIVTIVWLLN